VLQRAGEESVAARSRFGATSTSTVCHVLALTSRNTVCGPENRDNATGGCRWLSWSGSLARPSHGLFLVELITAKVLRAFWTRPHRGTWVEPRPLRPEAIPADMP
jgi:hypothetical protein